MSGALPGISLIVQPAGLDVRDLNDSVVVYDVTTRRTIALQPPASTLLKALLQGRDDAAAAIGPEDLESGSCADVEAAIVDLENAGLITVHDD